MECRTDNNRRSRKNCQEGKSNGYDKQTDDFLETFPNFMILTEEERHEFFQTLHSAKIKLEKSGVTVRPYFGTIHDQSWNNSDVLDIKNQKSIGNVSTLPRVETRTLQSNTPTNFKSNISIGKLNPVGLRNTAIHENPEKNLKEKKIRVALSQNLEPDLETNKSLKNVNFDEEEMGIKMLKEVHKNNFLKNIENSYITPSLSYEVLNHHDGVGKRPMYHQGKEEMLRIQGTKLKVQVTLTSGDNERIRRTLSKTKTVQINDRVLDDAEKSSGKTLGVFSSKDKDLEFEHAKSSDEKIDDPEIKDLLNVEEENKEELPEEKEKSQPTVMRKRSFEEGKSKAKGAELSRKNGLGKVGGEKKDVSRNLPQGQLLLEREWLLENTTLEDEKDRIFQKNDSKVPLEEEKIETNIRQQNDNKTQTSKSNSSILKEGSSEPKKDTKATQQRVLAVTTVKQGTGSNGSLEKQKTEVAGKKQNKKKSERQRRVEKLQKYLQKREGLYQQKIKKNDLKGQANEKSPDLKKKILNEEEAISEGNSKAVSENFCNEENKETEISRASEKKMIAVPCATKETEVEKDSIKADLDSTKVSELVKRTFEECIPSFKPGKVVFVDDNVIEKIRNVILDLEKKAKAYNCDTESEYLILVVEYVEYLSTVMATLFKDQILNSTIANPNVRFGEENLTKIQQRLQVSTPTTEDEFQSGEERDNKKKLKRNKSRKASFLKRLRKFFNCGKKKKRKKTASASADSPALKIKS